MVVSPQFMSPVREGFSSTASVRVRLMGNDKDASPGGWVVHLFGRVIGQQWTRRILHLIARKRLSISPLELLAVAAAVELLGISENRAEGQFVLRCDNTSVCGAAYTGGAYSPTMRLSLRMLTKMCERHKVTVRFWYICTVGG